MAHNVEPMDIDDIVSEFDDKENTFQHNNVLARTPSTEKGYEELDVSELNMKLRYSITPSSSPMSKSYTVNCADNRTFDSGDDPLSNIFINENGNLTRSLNITKSEAPKVTKALPLQTLPTDQLTCPGRSSSVLTSVDSSANAKNDITVTVTSANDIDASISYPSSSSSLDHTPEPITPTMDIPKHDGGSPIMRGLKTVLNMFRSSQSPIPPENEKNENLNPADVALPDYEDEDIAPAHAVASTPLATEKHKKCTSPLKESRVFNDDLEKELHWNEDSTIFFPNEKIPIHKLFFPQGKNNKPKENENQDVTVEYMDVSFNESVREKTMTEAQVNRTAVDSDSEFVDCETTFSKNDTINKDTLNTSCEQDLALGASILNATVPTNQTCVIDSGFTRTEDNKIMVDEVCSLVLANEEQHATSKQALDELEQNLCLNVTNTVIIDNINSNTTTDICSGENKTFDEICSPVIANVTSIIKDNNNSKQEYGYTQGELLSLNFTIDLLPENERSNDTTSAIYTEVNKTFVDSKYSFPEANIVNHAEECKPFKHKNAVSTAERLCLSFDAIIEDAIPNSNETTEREMNIQENASTSSSVLIPAIIPDTSEIGQETKVETTLLNTPQPCIEDYLKNKFSGEESLSNEKKFEIGDESNIQTTQEKIIDEPECNETPKDNFTNIKAEQDFIAVNSSHYESNEKSDATVECAGYNSSVSENTINIGDHPAEESFIPQNEIINSQEQSMSNTVVSETIVSDKIHLDAVEIECIQDKLTGDQKSDMTSITKIISEDELQSCELSNLQESNNVMEQTVLQNSLRNQDKCAELRDELNNEKSNEINAAEENSCNSSVRETTYEKRASENKLVLSPVTASCHSVRLETVEDTMNAICTDNKIKESPPSSPKIVSKGYNFNFDEIDDPFATKTKIRQSPPPDGINHTLGEIKTSVGFPKRDIKNQRRKSQPSRNKPSKVKSKFNATFDSTCEISTDKKVDVPSPFQHITEEKLNIQNTELASQTTPGKVEEKYPVDSDLLKNNRGSDIELPTQHIFENQSVDQNDDETEVLSKQLEVTPLQDVGIIPVDSVPTKIDTESTSFLSSETQKQASTDTLTMMIKSDFIVDNKSQTCTSSSEHSIYMSAGTSSTECVEQKNTFNLPEIDSSIEFNPFATKSKIRCSPDISLDVSERPIREIESKNIIEEVPVEEVPADTSYMTCSSKTADEKDATVQEIHTDSDDTVEGPFLEADDFDDKLCDFKEDDDMMKFSCVPTQTNDDNADAGEMFIDAEAFEFLLNQNQSSAVCDSGKESLFLKFDPLFAKRVSSSEGVAEALYKFRQRQRTPKKASPLSNHVEDPSAGPSKINITYEGEAHNIFDESNDELNITVSKPMMIVNPAVNPVATPRNNATLDTRRITSPAVAVIDRLLSMSANNSFVGYDNNVSNIGRENHETELALIQLRGMLADKKNSNKTYRDECEKLKDRLSVVETQLLGLEEEHEAKSKKCKELEEKLTEVTEMNKGMASVVEKYERTIATLIAETEQEKKRHAEERIQLIKERDEQTAHLTSMEISFNDLHSKYEKSKQIILTYKSNEEICLKSIAEYEENYDKIQKNYESLKQHATSKLNHANEELEKINRAHQSEVLKLNAMIKRRDVNISSLEETLAQKTKANEELTAICDELINKVG